MAAPDNILEEFERITRYDIRAYFIRFANFLENNHPKIISYYKGESNNIHTESFNVLSNLTREAKKILELASRSSKLFNNYKWWLFIEQIEDSLNVLETTAAAPKWLRSVENNVNFTTDPEVEITLQQSQTLEQLARKKLGFDNWDNDWDEIAKRNDLREEDYTPEGGVFLQVSFKNTFAPTVQTVVDTLKDNSIYGKDIYKKLTFEDNDLVTLNPVDTFKQSVGILILLKKEDNPEFPNQGYNSKLVVGSNVNFLNFPTLLRQLIETFKTDDTISSMRVLDFKRDEDAVYIQYEVEGRLGDIQQLNTTLT